ncbi:hypothetical protein [Mesorhizobium xinjiangense]|uniref:hypothetical protein n=1 Tax=Mesorhizobium xinjiangense TaxID=2678685 RepID=UPI0012ED13D4|nr:hypothetical protein [Mesorhizobium xinjiangense]
MASKTDQLEHDILRVFRCACRQGRADIAEFMLLALEKLDRDGIECPQCGGALIEAYREIAKTNGGGRN